MANRKIKKRIGLVLITFIFSVLMVASENMVSGSTLDFSDYLIDNESIDDFVLINYTYSDTAYSIVFDSEDLPVLIFELDDTVGTGGMLITDNSTIEEILTDYYQSIFYPSDEEFIQLEEYLNDFNASRNADTYYPTYQKTYEEPEAMCDRLLYLEHSDCAPDNEFGCKQLGSMICALYGEGCDPYALGDAAFEYVTLKANFDAALEDAYNTMEDIEEGDISENLEQLKEDIETVREEAENYADCVVRLPVNGSSECGDCLGICPAITFNYEVLDDMDELIDQLIEKVGPYSSMEDNIENAKEETFIRERYLITRELQPIYLQRFNSINNRYPDTLEEANRTLSKIVNTDLGYYYANAASLKNSLNEDITNYDVDNSTAQYLNQYESYLQSIEQILNQDNLTLSYDRFNNERSRVISSLIKAKWSIDRTNSRDVERINELGSLYNQYEGEYDPPMTDEQYDALYEQYHNLSLNLDLLLESTGGKGGIEGMIHRFSDGVNGFAASAMGWDEETSRMYQVILPVAVLLVIDVVLIVLAVFTFIHYTKTKRRFFIKRSVLMSWTVLLILFVIVVSVGSIGVYNVMKRTAEYTPFSIFESEVMEREEINLLVDYRGASASDTVSMSACYDLLKESFGSMNKTVNEYTITGDSCSAPDGNTYSPDDCYSMASKGAMINLYFSSTKEGYRFSIMPDLIGEFYGDKTTFDNCEIGYVFRYVSVEPGLNSNNDINATE